ncbi:hypothetical protein M0657_004699 [Pyricularia oryzae]|nr:hypothetical protein M9X92_005117 [Pyricularia oryzae]KAI7924354.1 hypothetical protein M0657_004699 [Pyricularia oryzae]
MTNTCFSCGDHVVICKGFLGVLMAVFKSVAVHAHVEIHLKHTASLLTWPLLHTRFPAKLALRPTRRAFDEKVTSQILYAHRLLPWSRSGTCSVSPANLELDARAQEIQDQQSKSGILSPEPVLSKATFYILLYGLAAQSIIQKEIEDQNTHRKAKRIVRLQGKVKTHRILK